MPRGGSITIETANVELDEDYAARHVGATAGPHVVLAVSDTGVGMDATTKERIFEPFFTTKERGKGTGLGLATVYGIVKQTGGNIWVYSEPEKGATFKVYLPTAEEGARIVEEAEDVQPAAAGSETILMVEDDEAVRRAAERILKSFGYEVLVARTPSEGLALCEAHEGPIHLLVTDVVLPGMSGPDLAASACVIRPEMKVLYVSGYADNAIVEHGVLKEGLSFLEKPFTSEGLARKVQEILGGGESL